MISLKNVFFINFVKLSTIFFCFLFFQLKAEAKIHDWVIQETSDNGKIHYKVIQEEDSLHDDQSRISQKVIEEKVLLPGQTFQPDKSLEAQPMALPKAGRPLWVAVKNQWTQADEDDYSSWIAQNANTDFNSAGVNADCADVGLLFRWVYARNHKLPIANTLSGSGKLFGHFSSSADWDKLKEDPDWTKDERFKAALGYLFNNTYTRSIKNDLAPVQVISQFVRPGTIYLVLRKDGSGHTQTINHIDLTDGIFALWGDDPPSPKIFSSELDIENSGDEFFASWRNTQFSQGTWTLIPAKSMPGYSLEIFQQSFDTAQELQDWIYSDINIVLSDEKVFDNLQQEVVDQFMRRQSWTEDGVEKCHYKSCDPRGSDYDNYDTTHRDARLRKTVADYFAYANKIGLNDPTVTSSFGMFSAMNVTFSEVTSSSFLEMMKNSRQMDQFKADPRVSYAERWGVDPVAQPDLAYIYQGAMLNGRLRLRDLSISYSKYDSTEMDSNIHLILKELNTLSTATGFSPGTSTQVFSDLNQSVLYSLILPESSSSLCSYNNSGVQTCYGSSFQAIWGLDGKTDQIDKWSSKVSDSSLQRWGF